MSWEFDPETEIVSWQEYTADAKGADFKEQTNGMPTDDAILSAVDEILHDINSVPESVQALREYVTLDFEAVDSDGL